jgi:hypothetical protein
MKLEIIEYPGKPTYYKIYCELCQSSWQLGDHVTRSIKKNEQDKEICPFCEKESPLVK